MSFHYIFTATRRSDNLHSNLRETIATALEESFHFPITEPSSSPEIIFIIEHQLRIYVSANEKKMGFYRYRAEKKLEKAKQLRKTSLARQTSIRAGPRKQRRSLLRPFNRSFSGSVHFNTKPTQIHCVELAVSIRQLRGRGCCIAHTSGHYPRRTIRRRISLRRAFARHGRVQSQRAET